MILFPDNTVLINFSLASCIDVIEELFKPGTLAWTEAVADECRRAGNGAENPDFWAWCEILSHPLILTPAERVSMAILHNEMLAPGEPSTKHLGEAETITVIESRFTTGAVFVTDDHSAARCAQTRSKRSGLTLHVAGTLSLVALAEAKGLIDEVERRRILRVLEDNGRTFVVPPSVAGYEAHLLRLRGQL